MKKKTRTRRLPTPKAFPWTEPDRFTTRQALYLALICQQPGGCTMTQVVSMARHRAQYQLGARDTWAVVNRLVELELVERKGSASAYAGEHRYVANAQAFDVLDRYSKLQVRVLEKAKIAIAAKPKRSAAKKTGKKTTKKARTKKVPARRRRS